jgi:hypothetical protein
MADVRKIIVIFVIAVIFAVLVQSLIEATYPQPKYEDFCKTDYYSGYYPGTKAVPADGNGSACQAAAEPTQAEYKSCSDIGGVIEYKYDYQGSCPTGFTCSTCQKEYNTADEKHKLIVFIISSIMGLIAIAVGLYLPIKNDLNEWIGSGFMLGGLFTLFTGTVVYYMEMGRFIRPIVMFIELCIVIYLAYKKLGRQDDGKNAVTNKSNKRAGKR